MTILDTPVLPLRRLPCGWKTLVKLKSSLSCGVHKAFRIYVAIYWKI